MAVKYKGFTVTTQPLLAQCVKLPVLSDVWCWEWRGWKFTRSSSCQSSPSCSAVLLTAVGWQAGQGE